MPCREMSHPKLALLTQEVREVIAGRALWLMLLLLGPLLGYGFVEAISLYSEASRAALQSPELARGLSPFDGILVPTFGAFYVVVTLLFPFVVIRLSGSQKQNGTLKLVIQLPYSQITVVTIKLLVAIAVWLAALVPELVAIAIWISLGGHVSGKETFGLLLGHFLYGVVVGAIALFAGVVAESAATAAIVVLAITIGSWALDFAAMGGNPVFTFFSGLSLTAVLGSFEHGLVSVAILSGCVVAAAGLLLFAGVWFPPGVPVRAKLRRTAMVGAAVALALLATSRIRLFADTTEDRRNSFSPEQERVLQSFNRLLTVTVHLSPEDPRYMDFRRSVLSKLERSVPETKVVLSAAGRSSFRSRRDEEYGQVVYEYDGHSASSRSTSPEEILPLLYDLAGIPTPKDSEGSTYPGYPLVVTSSLPAVSFYLVMPATVAGLCLWSRRLIVSVDSNSAATTSSSARGELT